MKRNRHLQRWATVAMAAVALAALALLWPAQLGGRVSFLTTVGSSMHPRIQEGDFALIRSGPPYRVGEVVAYRNGDLRQIALHRIIGAEDGRFRLQGDNNDFIDSYEPDESEIVGRLWVLLPNAGSWLDWLRQPRDAALATALLSMAIGTGVHQTRKRMRRRRSGEPVRGAGVARRGPRRLAPAPGAAPRAVWQRVAAGAAAITLLGGLSALYASAQPPLRDEVELVAYAHTGEFHYEAPALVGNDVLAGGAMRDGTPVYLRLASTLRVRFDYELTSEEPHEAEGTHRLIAVLSDTRGWDREIELQPATAFDTPTFSSRGTLSLPTLQAMIQRFQEQTGITNTNFQLRLVAEAEVRSTIAGVEVRDTFAPELPFTVDTFALQPNPVEGGDPLTPRQADTVQRDTRVPNELRLLGRGLAVADLRRTGAAAAGGAGAVLLIALLALSRSPAERPSERIARRYGSRMLDVQRLEPRPDERLVGMGDIKDLVRVADNLEAPILHLAQGTRHRYLVQEGATTYVAEVDDALGAQETAIVGPLPAPLAHPAPRQHDPQAPAPGAPHRPAGGGLRLPPPVVEIDLGEPLPPAPIGTPRAQGGLGLPPAPPRRPR